MGASRPNLQPPSCWGVQDGGADPELGLLKETLSGLRGLGGRGHPGGCQLRQFEPETPALLVSCPAASGQCRNSVK